MPKPECHQQGKDLMAPACPPLITWRGGGGGRGTRNHFLCMIQAGNRKWPADPKQPPLICGPCRPPAFQAERGAEPTFLRKRCSWGCELGSLVTSKRGWKMLSSSCSKFSMMPCSLYRLYSLGSCTQMDRHQSIWVSVHSNRHAAQSMASLHLCTPCYIVQAQLLLQAIGIPHDRPN